MNQNESQILLCGNAISDMISHFSFAVGLYCFNFAKAAYQVGGGGKSILAGLLIAQILNVTLY